MGHLIGRGGLFSLVLVLFLLPSLLVLCDRIIIDKAWTHPIQTYREKMREKRKQMQGQVKAKLAKHFES